MLKNLPLYISRITAWTIGIFFACIGLLALTEAPLKAMLLLVASALLIPRSAVWIERKTNLVMSRWSRVFVFVAGFILIGNMTGGNVEADQVTTTPPPPVAAQVNIASSSSTASFIVGSSESTATITSTANSSSTIQPDEAYVLDAIDGDTLRIRLADGTIDKVRIIGIDTPETVDPRKPVQCFGIEASAQMALLVKDKTVTLIRNPAEDRDIYQRLLRYIDLGGIDVGARMIADGYAFSYKQYPHPRLAAYNTLESSARNASKGLWGTCSASSSQEQSPAASQTTQKQASSAPTPIAVPIPINTQECVIKGNISTKDHEKIYHVPGCRSYNQTVIDESKGERWFCTEAEAQVAGWRKAKNCS